MPLGPVLTFDEDNWDQIQSVYFRAVDDGVSEGERIATIGHILTNSTDPDYRAATTLSVKVTIEDNDRKGLIITQSGRDNVLLEGAVAADSLATDKFDMVLSTAPKTGTTVTVTMTVLNKQITLSGTGVTATVLPDGSTQYQVTFNETNWNSKKTVTMKAINDSVVEGFHTDYIRFSVSSDDTGETRTVTDLAIDGDFDLPGVQTAIPDTKPTTYVLLPNAPKPGTLVVKIDGVQLADGTVDGDSDAINGITFDPANPLSGPARFKVSGNTLTFVTEAGFPELRTGAVTVSYEYDEPGYNNLNVRDLSVDIYDDDTPMVIVRPVDDGSVDVVEGGETDQYLIRLSREPDGLGKVSIKVDAVPTRTSFGRTAYFEEQVTVDGSSETVLTFDSSNWSSGHLVTVAAINDNVFDGNDTQVFAPDLQTVNKIRGPLIIEGAAGGGSLSLPAPLLLPHSPPVRFGTNDPVASELNILVPDGSVQAFEPGRRAGAVEFMTVLAQIS